MSFNYRFEPLNLLDLEDIDLSECEDCVFECGIHGYCIKEVQ